MAFEMLGISNSLIANLIVTALEIPLFLSLDVSRGFTVFETYLVLKLEDLFRETVLWENKFLLHKIQRNRLRTRSDTTRFQRAASCPQRSFS